MRQVIIHTFCDPDYQDELKTVDAKTITWFVNGERMEVDVCVEHERTIALHQMDEFVLRYGRPWMDPDNPPKPVVKRTKKSGAQDPATAEVPQGRWDAEREAFFCTVKGCVKKDEPWPKLQAFRMHQRAAHAITAPPRRGKK